MQLHAMGGQTPYEVLRASTIEGAISLGLQSSIGSLSVGKLADLVIYPLGVDTVEKVFEKSWDMEFVMRGNRLFSVRDGLMEVWPRAGRRQDRPRFDPETEI
jgi:imidazolonepropionase-like amidohydrolase